MPTGSTAATATDHLHFNADAPRAGSPREPGRIIVTDADHVRLREMMSSLRTVGDPFRAPLSRLKNVLETARIVPAAEVDRDVVTMNSHLRVRGRGEAQLLSLVFHGDSDPWGTRLSVLSSLGTALLGRRVGDWIQWESAAGVQHLFIERLLYQPEVAGQFHL